MENLKNVNVNSLTDEQIKEHVDNVLKMEHDKIMEYLTYVVDEQYLFDTNEEINDNEPVVKFLKSESLKPFLTEMSNVTEVSTEVDNDSE